MGAKDHDEVTALMNAAESGSLEAVEALLSKGADAGSMSATAFTPLIVAAAGGHLEVVQVSGCRGTYASCGVWNEGAAFVRVGCGSPGQSGIGSFFCRRSVDLCGLPLLDVWVWQTCRKSLVTVGVLFSY